MKKCLKKIMLVAMGFIVACGFSAVSITAKAEAVDEVVDEVIEIEDEKVDEVVDEETSTTFQDFLEWSKLEAEKYGYGDEYKAALEAIKTAASEKQVTLATISSLGLSIITLAYIIYKRISDKKFREDVANLAKTIDVEFEKFVEELKALKESETENANVGKEVLEEGAKILKKLSKEKKAITGLINGFMHFADGVKLNESKKAEVQRDLTKALGEIENKE